MEILFMRINPSCDRTTRWSGLLSAVLLAFALLWNPQIAGAEYREVEVKNGGTITGKVSFRGELPQDAVENFPVSGRWPGCGTGYRKIVTIDTKDAALRGVFVLLDGITAGKKWPEPNSVAELDQKRCEFVPTHQVVRRGASMIIRNSDTGVLHNVNLREIVEVPGRREVRRMMFNIAQPVVGEIEKKIKPQESPFIVVGCDLHYFMSAHIVAPEHPYAALVNEDGTYLLDDVPPGVHSATAWHPRLGKKKVSVTVPANGTVEANFEFGE
jgi:hypothetical protein